MKEDDNNVYEAKKALKAHIKFFESCLKHLNSNNEQFKCKSMWVAWALHRYLNDGLIADIEKAMLDSRASNDALQ